LSSGAIPFSLGALAYHLHKRRLAPITLSYGAAWLVTACCWGILALNIRYEIIPHFREGLYVAAVSTAVATLTLALARPPASAFLQALDTWGGQHSYALFLCHVLA